MRNKNEFIGTSGVSVDGYKYTVVRSAEKNNNKASDCYEVEFENGVSKILSYKTIKWGKVSSKCKCIKDVNDIVGTSNINEKGYKYTVTEFIGSEYDDMQSKFLYYYNIEFENGINKVYSRNSIIRNKVSCFKKYDLVGTNGVTKDGIKYTISKYLGRDRYEYSSHDVYKVDFENGISKAYRSSDILNNSLSAKAIECNNLLSINNVIKHKYKNKYYNKKGDFKCN